MQIVKTEVQKLSKNLDRVVKEHSDQGVFPSPGPIPSLPGSASTSIPSPLLPPPLRSVPLRPSAGGSTDGPHGHHLDQRNRDLRYGPVTFTLIPDKGTYNASSSQSYFAKSPSIGGNWGDST